MQNDRPCNDAHLARCREEIVALLDHYDLAGAVCLVNEQEWETRQ